MTSKYYNCIQTSMHQIHILQLTIFDNSKIRFPLNEKSTSVTERPEGRTLSFQDFLCTPEDEK